MRIEHARRIGAAPQPAFQMGLIGEPNQRLGQIRPRFAAVAAAQHTADFQRRVNVIGSPGVGGDADGARGKTHRAMAGVKRGRQPDPVVTAIFTAIQAHRRGPRIHHLGARRVKHQRPDHNAALRKPEALPRVAAIGAAIRAILRAGVNDVAVRRMKHNHARLDMFRQTLAQRLPRRIAKGAVKRLAKKSTQVAGAVFQGEISAAREHACWLSISHDEFP